MSNENPLILFTKFTSFTLTVHCKQPSTKPKNVNFKKSFEYRIKRKILHKYDPTTRPVKNDSSTIQVNLAISLYHILDTVFLILPYFGVHSHHAPKANYFLLSFLL